MDGPPLKEGELTSEALPGRQASGSLLRKNPGRHAGSTGPVSLAAERKVAAQSEGRFFNPYSLRPKQVLARKVSLSTLGPSDSRSP